MDVDTWSPPFRFVYLCDGITITNDFMIIAGRDILLQTPSIRRNRLRNDKFETAIEASAFPEPINYIMVTNRRTQVILLLSLPSDNVQHELQKYCYYGDCRPFIMSSMRFDVTFIQSCIRYRPMYHLRLSLVSPLQSVLRTVGAQQSLFPPPHYSTRHHFYGGKGSACSTVVDSRRHHTNNPERREKTCKNETYDKVADPYVTINTTVLPCSENSATQYVPYA